MVPPQSGVAGLYWGAHNADLVKTSVSFRANYQRFAVYCLVSSIDEHGVDFVVVPGQQLVSGASIYFHELRSALQQTLG